MYAVFEFKGFQYRAEMGKTIAVPYMAELNEGAGLEIDHVMLCADDHNNIQIGRPYVGGARIKAEVVDHFRGDKLIVYKKKRRKTYEKKQGHRQDYTRILIKELSF